jgi:hypothetical protein
MDHKDEAIFLEDGRRLMTYSPREGGLTESDNRALLKCMADRVPLGVFRQLTARTDRQQGSTYQVLGLGLITSYDRHADVFVVESADQASLEQVTGVIREEEERYEVHLYAQLTSVFEWDAQKALPNLRKHRISDDMLPEYDFTGRKGTRGKFYDAYRQGHTVRTKEADRTVGTQYFTLQDGAVLLEPDVRAHFPDSESVNKALHSLIALIPTKAAK